MPLGPKPDVRSLKPVSWLVAIACAYLYIFPYFPRIRSANELPRAYLVKAIVEERTFAIDREVQEWGGTADVSPYGQHQYSNKAPGSSLLVVPVSAAVRLVAGEPSLQLTMWLCRIVAGIIPALLFLWLLSRFLARYTPDEPTRILVIVAYALGSLAMTYSLLFYSHQLAAICIASAWILLLDVLDRHRSTRWMLAVGALAGAAPLVDYQAVFAAVPIAVYAIVRMWRWPRGEQVRAIALAAAAAAVPITVLLAYHAVCFDSPWRTGYDASQTFAHFHQHGFLGITELRWEAFWGSLFSLDNGLFALSPWWLLAIPGGIVLWRRGERGQVAVAAAIAVVFVLFVSSINFWRGGWGVGPRYITAMLPFQLPLVAVALAALRERRMLLGAAAGTICVGVVIYTLSSATLPYWPDSLRDPLYDVTFRLLANNAVAPNLARTCGISGLPGLIPYLAIVFGVTGWAVVRAAGWRGFAVAVGVAAVVIAAYGLVPHGGAEPDRAFGQTLYPAVVW